MDSASSYTQLTTIGAGNDSPTSYQTMVVSTESEPPNSKLSASPRASLFLRPLWVVLTILLVVALFLRFYKSLLPIATRAVLAPVIPFHVYQNHSHDTCFVGDSDCPPCPSGRNVSVTSLLHLSSILNIQKHVFRAQQEIWAMAPSEASIIRMEDLQTLHSSLNYWCCHTPAEQADIVTIVKNLEWRPIPLVLNRVSCNVDHDNRTVYMLSVYNEESQARLWDFIHRIEDAMRAAGIPVINPRHQLFHSTLARVVADEYPVDAVVPRIHAAVPEFASFHMSVFEVAGELIYAKP